VREVLCPSLRPGDIVVMDNLGPHQNEQTLALLAAAGASVRFLPAYSPDLNPIEMMGSKLKALLRAAEELQRAIAAALQRISAQDAVHWFAACGYSII
jgi:transposase